MQGLYELVTVCREQKTKRVTEGKLWEDRFLWEISGYFIFIKKVKGSEIQNCESGNLPIVGTGRDSGLRVTGRTAVKHMLNVTPSVSDL